VISTRDGSRNKSGGQALCKNLRRIRDNWRFSMPPIVAIIGPCARDTSSFATW
jgi:hypothetical protein